MPATRTPCFPFCEYNCKVKHHPLLMKLNDVEVSEPIDEELQKTIKRFFRKHRPNQIFNGEGDNCLYPLLHWSCVFGKPNITEYLIKQHYHNPAIKAPGKKQTALHRTILCLHIGLGLSREKTTQDDIIEIFDKLFDLLKNTLSCQDDNRDTPLHICATYIADKIPSTEDSLTDVDERIAENEFAVFTNYMITMMNEIVEEQKSGKNGNIYDIQNSEGNTVLHILCKATRKSYPLEEIIVKISKRCNSLSIKNSDGYTPSDILESTGVLDVSLLTIKNKKMSLKNVDQSLVKRKRDNYQSEDDTLQKHDKDGIPTKVTKSSRLYTVPDQTHKQKSGKRSKVVIENMYKGINQPPTTNEDGASLEHVKENIPTKDKTLNNHYKVPKQVHEHKSVKKSKIATGNVCDVHIHPDKSIEKSAEPSFDKEPSATCVQSAVTDVPLSTKQKLASLSERANNSPTMSAAQPQPGTSKSATKRCHTMIERSSSVNKFNSLMQFPISPPKRHRRSYGMSLQRSTSFSPPSSPQSKSNRNDTLLESEIATPSKIKKSTCSLPIESSQIMASTSVLNKKIGEVSEDASSQVISLEKVETNSTSKSPIPCSPPRQLVTTIASMLLPPVLHTSSLSSHNVTMVSDSSPCKAAITATNQSTSELLNVTIDTSTKPLLGEKLIAIVPKSTVQIIASPTLSKTTSTISASSCSKSIPVTTSNTVTLSSQQTGTSTKGMSYSTASKKNEPVTTECGLSMPSVTAHITKESLKRDKQAVGYPPEPNASTNATKTGFKTKDLSLVSDDATRKQLHSTIIPVSSPCKPKTISPDFINASHLNKMRHCLTKATLFKVTKGKNPAGDLIAEKSKEHITNPKELLIAANKTGECEHPNTLHNNVSSTDVQSKENSTQDEINIISINKKACSSKSQHLMKDIGSNKAGIHNKQKEANINMKQVNMAGQDSQVCMAGIKEQANKVGTTTLLPPPALPNMKTSNLNMPTVGLPIISQKDFEDQTAGSRINQPSILPIILTIKEEKEDTIQLIPNQVHTNATDNSLANTVSLSKSKRKYSIESISAPGSQSGSRPQTPSINNDSGMSCDENIDDVICLSNASTNRITTPSSNNKHQHREDEQPKAPERTIKSFGKQMKDWHTYSSAELDKNVYIRSGSRRESYEGMTSDRCSSVESSASTEMVAVVQPQITNQSMTSPIAPMPTNQRQLVVSMSNTNLPMSFTVDQTAVTSNSISPRVVSACTMQQRPQQYEICPTRNVAPLPQNVVSACTMQQRPRQNEICPTQNIAPLPQNVRGNAVAALPQNVQVLHQNTSMRYHNNGQQISMNALRLPADVPPTLINMQNHQLQSHSAVRSSNTTNVSSGSSQYSPSTPQLLNEDHSNFNNSTVHYSQSLPQQAMSQNQQTQWIEQNNMSSALTMESLDKHHNVPGLKTLTQQLLNTKRSELARIGSNFEVANISEARSRNECEVLYQQYRNMVSQVYKLQEKVEEQRKNNRYWLSKKGECSTQMIKAREEIQKLSESLNALNK